MGVVRQTISRNSVLGPFARSAHRWLIDLRLNPTRSHSVIDVTGRMPAFAPSSYGSYADLASLTIEAVNGTVPALLELLDDVDRPGFPEIDVDAFCSLFPESGDPTRLQELFNEFGSDKGQTHDYYKVYAAVLGDPDTVECIFEVGIGTNHLDVVSSMGSGGRPGASLRAFREYAPSAQVIGADIDERILFAEERIRTFALDQTDPQSWSRLKHQLSGSRFDLVVDDGLHVPHANIRTLGFGLSHLKTGGWMIVEDIAPASGDVWRLVGRLIQSPQYQPYLVCTRAAMVFAVQRKANEPY